MKWGLLLILGFAILMTTACQPKKENPEAAKLRKMIAQFSPVEIKYDHSLLDERKQKVVENLYHAARIIDEIFLDQVYAKNFQIRKQLQESTDPLDKLRLEYFNIMFGPFDRLNHNKPFIGNEPKPKGANFYPADMTRQEFENWLKQHPEDEAAFTSERTMIRRQDGKLVAIPYSEYYKDQLIRAADYLKKAAQFADNPSLKSICNCGPKPFYRMIISKVIWPGWTLKITLLKSLLGHTKFTKTNCSITKRRLKLLSHFVIRKKAKN